MAWQACIEGLSEFYPRLRNEEIRARLATELQPQWNPSGDDQIDYQQLRDKVEALFERDGLASSDAHDAPSRPRG